MEIRNRETGAVITISEFKAEHPRTAFPKQINTLVLDSYGYDAVLNGPSATTSGPYETSVRDGVEEVNGQWFTKFVVGPIFTDNDEGTAAEQEAAYRARIDSEAGASVRAERASKLAASDWTVLTDSPLTTAKKTEWKTYRQALRDIPSAEGFPHDVTWPSEPS
ncbi:MAG: hypothetical protein DWQ28_08040 [Proteobacteria bacterium]|nr:MAG: hypothetical protein DWQ28_08040 [Pseudomonadota bacterium]